MLPSEIGGLLNHVQVINTQRDHIHYLPWTDPLPWLRSGDIKEGDRWLHTQYEKFTLTPHKLCVKSEVFDQKFRQPYYAPIQQFRNYIDRAIIYGDGLSKPLGVVNTTSCKRLEGDYKLSYDLMMEAIYSLPRTNDWYAGAWLMHPNTIQKLVHTPTFEAGGTEALFGKHVLETTAVEEDDIILADLRYYIVGMQGGLKAERFDHWDSPDTFDITHWLMLDGRPIVRDTIDEGYPFILIRLQYDEVGTETTIRICKYCGTAWPMGIKCWDGVCGCGASILPAQGNQVCVYCGRIWPPGFDTCWDGVDGCGGALGTSGIPETSCSD